jgi:hypothetical protein
MIKRVVYPGLIAGIILFTISYGGLYAAVRFFPSLFTEYSNPLFNSNGSRDVLFYLHAFVISLSLSWFWDRFKTMFRGNLMLRGLEFGLVYSMIALLPVMWITISSLDVTFLMVASWFVYGLVQAVMCGLMFARINP